MFKLINLLVITALFVLTLCSFGLAQTQPEQLTITTYYPSPFGSYRELRSMRMAIGDNYIQGSQYCWQGTCTNTIDANADLVVEGNVGIGTTSPGAMLDVVGSIQTQMTNINSRIGVVLRNPNGFASIYSNGALGNGLGFYTNSDEVNVRMVIDSTGNVGIANLTTNGAVYSNGTYLTNTSPSSVIYKKNIKSVHNLNPSRLLKLQPKSFQWKSNGKQDFGYIAEEVQNALPELWQDDGITRGYDVAKLPIYLVELAKEQQKQIDHLKTEIKSLKAQLKASR